MSGKISDKDAGVDIDAKGGGMVLLVEPELADVVERDLARRGERTFRIGRTVAGEGRVRWGRA